MKVQESTKVEYELAKWLEKQAKKEDRSKSAILRDSLKLYKEKKE